MIYTLHGWSYDKGVWRGTPFEGACHLELPGHGESPFKSTKILELSKELGKTIKKNSTLVGWSLGATVASVVAYLYPEKVRELILYAPTTSFVGVSQPEVVVKRFFRKLERNFYEGLIFFRKLCSKREYKVNNLKSKEALELLKDFSYFKLDKLIKETEVPIKVIVGDEDEITGLAGAFSVFKAAKRSQLKVVPREDHLTVLEHTV
ncbi:alpha/beta fold hydrolase [Thermovibrio sp.]